VSGDNSISETFDIRFAVGKAILTITPNNSQSKAYGTTDPPLTYAASGQISGETPSFTGTLGRDPGENIGTYNITAGNLALASNLPFDASNYTLSFVTGKTFAITAGTQTTPQFADHATIYRTFGAAPFNLPAVTGGESTGACVYRSSDRSVATVDASGRVTLTGPGTAVIYVKKSGDSNYADSGEDSITIYAAVPPPPPTPIKRQVYLPASTTFTYDPPAGVYYVDSRSAFTFVVIGSSSDLDRLKVTTGTARDTDGHLVLDRLSTDSVRVTIYLINENIRITVTAGSPDGNEAVNGLKVWSHGGQICITSPASGTARIYSLTGQLVKQLTCTSGETDQQPLAAGVYIVKTESGTWKVIVN
jgi:hypothetical protein